MKLMEAERERVSVWRKKSEERNGIVMCCVMFCIQRKDYCILFWDSDTNPAIDKQVDMIP